MTHLALLQMADAGFERVMQEVPPIDDPWA